MRREPGLSLSNRKYRRLITYIRLIDINNCRAKPLGRPDTWDLAGRMAESVPPIAYLIYQKNQVVEIRL